MLLTMLWLCSTIWAIALVVCSVCSFIWFSVVPICSVASAVFDAKALTSSATTANPRPCSPARAASIAAFKANKFVWADIPSITLVILWISAAFCESDLILSAVLITSLFNWFMTVTLAFSCCEPSDVAVFAWFDCWDAIAAFSFITWILIDICWAALASRSTSSLDNSMAVLSFSRKKLTSAEFIANSLALSSIFLPALVVLFACSRSTSCKGALVEVSSFSVLSSNWCWIFWLCLTAKLILTKAVKKLSINMVNACQFRLIDSRVRVIKSTVIIKAANNASNAVIWRDVNIVNHRMVFEKTLLFSLYGSQCCRNWQSDFSLVYPLTIILCWTIYAVIINTITRVSD